MTDAKTIRIGGACGFWGESARSTPQLLAADVDVLIYDYLAEITMSILARARAKDPKLGYATDFVTAVVTPHLERLADRRVKIVSNAGGLNPQACADALREAIARAGVELKVAAVLGDDLTDRLEQFQSHAPTDMNDGAPFPSQDAIVSANAYFGAFPIAEALRGGADIVITGRCADSALVLGPCVHAFGWDAGDYDRLAAASLAGHLIECGPQATGGNFTDWDAVSNLHDIGYPIAEVYADGIVEISKPAGSGGLVSRGTVSEQLLYEIGDPQTYLLPDVVCDFSQVTLEDAGPDRVKVQGARGAAPTDTLKVSATYRDGHRVGMLLSFYGMDADRRARRFAEAALRRAAEVLEAYGAPPYTETSVEVLGAEDQFGRAKRTERPRDVVLKLAAKHPLEAAAGVLIREATGLGLATPPGLSIFNGGRPKPQPVIRLYSGLFPKQETQPYLAADGADRPVSWAEGAAYDPTRIVRPSPPETPDFAGGRVDVPLIRLAWARSGDKGDDANVGVIARRPEFLPFLWAALDEETVAVIFAHVLEGDVERYLLPGPSAINFVLRRSLGGGGVSSLRNDPQGKGFAQLMLEHPIPVAGALAERLA